MDRRPLDFPPGGGARRSAFTLIEILVVISIIAVMLAILMPALSHAREQGKRAVCMSNMRQIGTAMVAYLDDGHDNLPWTFVFYIDRGSRFHFYPGTRLYSSYSWGGMLAPNPYAEERGIDSSVIPPELRPLNRYLDPSISGGTAMKVVQCPGDRSAYSPIVGEGPEPLVLEGPKSSWEAYGTSYSINWAFMTEPTLIPYFSHRGGHPGVLYVFGKDCLRRSWGGSGASEFVVMWENQVDQLWPTSVGWDQGRRGEGWHRRYSNHTFLFLDGHVEHRYFDTRKSTGDRWRIWRSWKIREPFGDY
jgi:prepilin-type N-terminal cleavage/methylation domain-containing protein/prepilin-type processing-associated H-X9-DG protein